MDWSAIAGAAVSAGSGLAGAITNRRSQARAFEINRKLMHEQYGLEREQQDYQNEYNTPANQRARMEAAGFNPNDGDISSFQSADAAAPDPTPMQPLDYSSSMNQIGNSINAYFDIQSKQQQLNFQKLKNEEQSLQNDLLARNSGNQYSLDFLKRTDTYQKLIANGVDDDMAYSIAFGNQRNQGWYPESGTMSYLGRLALSSKEWLANHNKWASKQQEENYWYLHDTRSARTFGAYLDNDVKRAGANELMRKYDFLKEVDKKIDGMNITPFEKSLLKMTAQSQIYNGLPDSLNPLEWLKTIAGARAGAAKTFSNHYSNTYNKFGSVNSNTSIFK